MIFGKSKVFIPLVAGLGDMLMTMLSPNFAFGYLKDLRAKHPDVTTKVITLGNSDQAPELVKLQPYIDLFEHRPFSTDWGSEKIDSHRREGEFDLFDNYDGLTWERPKIVISDNEEDIIRGIFSKPYLAFHPYAGHPSRAFAQYFNFEDCVRALCHLGVNVVLLGGSHSRNDQGGRAYAENSSVRVEPLHRFLDLRNRGTVRLHALVTSRAAKFIGTTSVYNCVAQVFKVPTLSYTSTLNARYIKNDKGGVFAMMRENGAKVHLFAPLQGNPIRHMVDFAMDGSVKWNS